MLQPSSRLINADNQQISYAAQLTAQLNRRRELNFYEKCKGYFRDTIIYWTIVLLVIAPPTAVVFVFSFPNISHHTYIVSLPKSTCLFDNAIIGPIDEFDKIVHVHNVVVDDMLMTLEYPSVDRRKRNKKNYYKMWYFVTIQGSINCHYDITNNTAFISQSIVGDILLITLMSFCLLCWLIGTILLVVGIYQTK